MDIDTWPEPTAQYYRSRGYWTGEDLGSWLRHRSETHPDRTALVCGERHWSYGQLDHRVDCLAASLLSLGIGTGDRVVLQLPNVGEFVLLLFALFRIGAVPVLALPGHRRTEIVHFVRFVNAVGYFIADVRGRFDYRTLASEVRAACPSLRHVVVAGDAGEFLSFDSLLEAPPLRLAAREGRDLALFQLSGGTTGTPKLIPRTHDDYGYSVRESARICQLNEQSRYLATLPVAHNFPLSSPGILGALWASGRVVMSEATAYQDAIEILDRERITITAVVPPLALAWVETAEGTGRTPRTLQVLQVGGARLGGGLARRIGPALGCKLQQVFGMAEGLVNYTRLDDPPEVVFETQGRPLSEADELRIVDDEGAAVAPGEIGNLLVRGPYTIRGYYRRSDYNQVAFTPDGFYRTGDKVRLTESGNLVVEGRAKDVVNRGGDKVCAEELEQILRQHPAISDAAVVGLPDPALGERTYACLIASANLSLLELRRWLRDYGVADFKFPDALAFFTKFPASAAGKTNKLELRQQLEASQALTASALES